MPSSYLIDGCGDCDPCIGGAPCSVTGASDRASPYTPHNLTPPGVTCPCDLCNYRRTTAASAVWWIGRALRALAGFDEEETP